MRVATICAAASVALAGCGESTPADYDAEPDPVAMPTPTDTPVNLEVPHVEGTQAALGADETMPGEWVPKPMAGSPAALFGPPNAEPGLSVRCEDDELIVARGVTVPAGSTRLTLVAGGESVTIPATARTDPLPQVTGRLGRNHPFADVLAVTPAPIAVAVADGPSYRVPTSDVLRQVVSDCAT